MSKDAKKVQPWETRYSDRVDESTPPFDALELCQAQMADLSFLGLRCIDYGLLERIEDELLKDGRVRIAVGKRLVDPFPYRELVDRVWSAFPVQEYSPTRIERYVRGLRQCLDHRPLTSRTYRATREQLLEKMLEPVAIPAYQRQAGEHYYAVVGREWALFFNKADDLLANARDLHMTGLQEGRILAFVPSGTSLSLVVPALWTSPTKDLKRQMKGAKFVLSANLPEGWLREVKGRQSPMTLDRVDKMAAWLLVMDAREGVPRLTWPVAEVLLQEQFPKSLDADRRDAWRLAGDKNPRNSGRPSKN